MPRLSGAFFRLMDNQQDEQIKQAMITSLRFLAASPKTKQELRRKLEAKGYPVFAIQAALKNLAEQGILDDLAYAKNLVSRLQNVKGAGKHRIAFELKRKGVHSALQNQILGTLDSDQETQRALELARWKWEQSSKLPLEKRRKRLYDFLIRKGYDFQIAQDVLSRITRKAGPSEI